jgi:hypothetical protein
MAMALMPTVEEGKQIRDVLLAGASGAIWGILVALVMWLWLNWDELSQDQAQFWIRRLLLVLALNLALSFGPGISWLGHLAGGFTGGLLLIALHWSLRRQIRGPLLILLLIVLLGGILPVGTKSFTSWKELKDRVQSQKERRIRSTYLTVRTNAQLLMDRYRNGLFLLDSKSPLVVKTTQDLERFQQDLQQIRQIADKNQDHAELGELLPRAEEFAQAFAEVLKTQNQPNLDRLVKAWDALQALPMK